MAESASHHPSVQALLTEALPGESACDVIRRKAREILAKHRHLWRGPPFCPFALADLEGIIVQEAAHDIQGDGRIFPIGNQVYIEYSAGQTPERARFTVCHELAHTLFPDCFIRERRRTPAEKEEWEFENLCNTAASEFLFPLEEFTADIGCRQRLRANEIRDLALRYKASIDATARRYVGLCKTGACVVFAQYREPDPGKVVSLFVQYSAPNNKFPHHFQRNYKIFSTSVANHAQKSQKALGATNEAWMVHGKWVHFDVETIPLPKIQSKEAADLAIILYAR